MSAAATRKGASRAADLAPDVLAALSRGEIQSATLTECLAVDQERLLVTVFPTLPLPLREAVRVACRQGILKRMRSIADLLWAELGGAGIDACVRHGSDTVRGWSCFMIGAQPGLDLDARLDAIRTLADDPHFGVREWAWLALRPHLAAALPAAIERLAGWTSLPSERLRRFACEALRPRGVWCAHLAPLKKDPAMALPVLSPLRADPSGYVQDSVANWLNDAAKDQPRWVSALCEQWSSQSQAQATARICKRALRNVKQAA